MRGWCGDGDGFCGDDAGTGTGFWKLRGWGWGSVLQGWGGDGVDEICAVRGWGRTLDPVSLSSRQPVGATHLNTSDELAWERTLDPVSLSTADVRSQLLSSIIIPVLYNISHQMPGLSQFQMF